MIKKASKIFLVLLGFWAAARFSHHQTKGFRLSKLQNNTADFSAHSSPLPPECRTILNQSFRYYGRGLQSFSFLSEDGKTILKLFNNRYQTRLFWLRFFPFKEKISRNRKKLEHTFTSYEIASKDLKEETGLIYFHPTRSTDCPMVTLQDPLGIKHILNLNQYAFVLQKRAILVYPFFAECAREGKENEARAALHSLFFLFKEKFNRGIADRDPLLRTNFGFSEGKAMQIDLGAFSYDEEVKKKQRQKEEMEKITLALKIWLENHYPELIPEFTHALQNF